MDIYRYIDSTINSMGTLLTKRSVSSDLRRVVRGPRVLTVDIKLNDPDDYKKAIDIAEPLRLAVGVDSIMTYIHRGAIRYEVLLPEGLWKEYSLSEFSDGMSIGVASDRSVVNFTLDRPNTLIIGESGSGKTNLAHAILIQSMNSMPSDMLKIGIADPHGGFAHYANKAHLAGPPASSRAEIADVFDWFNGELSDRMAMGEAKVRREGLPLLMLVADELSSADCLGEKGFLNKENLYTLKALVKEGRKFNMRVLMITQKPTEEDMPGILSIATTRYIGRISKAVGKNLANSDIAEPHLLTGKGDFFYTSPNQVSRFQAAIVDDNDFSSLPSGEYDNWPESYHDWDDEEDESPSGGRPKVEVEPEILATYMKRNISRSTANDLFGFGQTVHNRYKNFAKRLVQAMEYE